MCSISAVYIPRGHKNSGNAIKYLDILVSGQENRGQDGVGVTIAKATRKGFVLTTHKGEGSIEEVLGNRSVERTRNLAQKLQGNMGIGHGRYTTSGENDDIKQVQPVERDHVRVIKRGALAFNGNITNHDILREELEQLGKYELESPADTHMIMYLLSKEIQSQVHERKRDKLLARGVRALKRTPLRVIGDTLEKRLTDKIDMVKAWSKLSKILDGAYSAVYLTGEGNLYAIRDPLGIRPLCYGTTEDGVLLFASESTALINAGVRRGKVKSLEPGHILAVEDGKTTIKQYAKNGKKARCRFEYEYFALAGSVIDKISVYRTRFRSGKLLAENEMREIVENPNDYVVVPVPDTSKAAAAGYAEALNIKNREGLLRNRGSKRSFIESEERRAEKVRRKYFIQREVMEGKKVILIDDSIVRGATMRELIKRCREEGGAAEVHVRSAYPPVIAPCFYGINMSTVIELFAPTYFKGMNPTIPEKQMMARALGADSINYNTVEDSIKATGSPGSEFCLACITGKYPTTGGRRKFKQAVTEYRRDPNPQSLRQ